MSLTIRPATVQDIDMIRDILADNGQLHEQLSYVEWTGPTLVAVRDGEVVGVIQALLGQPYAVVTEVAVTPMHHRKGYAVKLMQAMELLMRVAGVTAYVLFAGEKNERVRAQALKWGCEKTGNGAGFLRRLS